MWNKRTAGVTLIELVVAIVIVAVALAGLVAAFTRTDRASVDPVVTQQMAIVAEGLMEEILLKDYANGNPAANRIGATKVTDYDGYHSHGIVDAEGNAVAGLAAYDVVVRAGNPDPAHALQGVPAADTLRVEVKVTNTRSDNEDGDAFVLVGWRTRPPAPPPAPPAPPAGSTP
jgi:MSHA pilin protein MshD